MAHMMDGLLVEFTLTSCRTLRLTLEIEGRAEDGGYPKCVVDTIKASWLRPLRKDLET